MRRADTLAERERLLGVPPGTGLVAEVREEHGPRAECVHERVVALQLRRRLAETVGELDSGAPLVGVEGEEAGVELGFHDGGIAAFDADPACLCEQVARTLDVARVLAHPAEAGHRTLADRQRIAGRLELERTLHERRVDAAAEQEPAHR